MTQLWKSPAGRDPHRQGGCVRLAAFLLVVALVGCSLPVQRKEEIRAERFNLGPPARVCGDYLKLARYWDEKATKVSMDLASATFLNVIPEEKRAEISIGTGPYHALLDLKSAGAGVSELTAYSVHPLKHFVLDWQDLLGTAHDKDAALVGCMDPSFPAWELKTPPRVDPTSS